MYLGAYGSPESKAAYTRLIVGLRADTTPYSPSDKENVSVKALVLSFLDHVKGTIADQNYGHHRAAVKELLANCDFDIPASSFTPSCLKRFRQTLINSKRFCRNMIND
ncbi:MAG: hypothetical protein LBI05_10290 [Planctomycetaceae bacterium]|nr:hypothetical protein [Planctomycetaceae bacterium]